MAMKLRGAKRKVNWRFVAFALLILFVFSTVQLVYYADNSLRPTMMNVAEEYTKQAATEAINDSIAKRISADTNYSRLINFREGANGKVTAGYFDLQEATKIQEKATLSVQDALHGLQAKKLSVPMGMAFNNSILAQSGPDIPITVTPVGHVTSNVGVETRDAGINQTVHILYIDLHVETKVLIPFATKDTDIHTRAPLAYLVMVGDVPQVVYNAKGEKLAQGTQSQLVPPLELPKLGDAGGTSIDLSGGSQQ